MQEGHIVAPGVARDTSQSNLGGHITRGKEEATGIEEHTVRYRGDKSGTGEWEFGDAGTEIGNDQIRGGPRA